MTPPVLRPIPRAVFLAKERQPLVYFYTSNLSKFMQARLAFERAGLVLYHFKSRKDPYSEDYSVGKQELLARAIQEVSGTVGSASLFFVEDTSLRIEALSATEEFPGLAVKEWFQATPFCSLDSELRARGTDRRATVKSDIALHIPGLSRPIYFHGETPGEIAEAPPAFAEDRQHPWLTPHTFNGWLIPDGATKRLGEMTLEESWRFDFRIRSLESLLDRLEEYTGVLNLSGQGYRVRRAQNLRQQLSLFSEQPAGLVFIVVGYTCAGKTTFAEYANTHHRLAFIEASAVMRMLAKEARIERQTAFASAQELLSKHGPDIVARKIVDLYSDQLSAGAVISGFRAIEELEVIRDHCPQAKVVVIGASERVRFQRCVNRDRETGPSNLREFRDIDSEQGSFGLVRIAEDFADVRVINEGSLSDYYAAIDAVVTKPDLRYTSRVSENVQPRIPSEDNQLFRCLSVLDAAARPLSCDEIQARTTRDGHVVRHNNANKVLKRAPALARRLEVEGTRVRYEITNAGRAYLRYLGRYIREHQQEHESSQPIRAPAEGQ
jgi:inosine/xanthosine triphosphate pyrophosphatase family protein/dephospho-CoA kinase